MKELTLNQVHALKVGELGLDAAALDLTATESLAAALRRAASLRCPCSARTLIREVSQPLRGLVNDSAALDERINETLEALVAYGDLIECATELDGDKPVRYLLHAAAPSFVPRSNGSVLLVGVLRDSAVFPVEIASRVEQVNHVRRLKPSGAEKLADVLIEYGLQELRTEDWSGEPTRLTPTQYERQLNDALGGVAPAREVPGLTILDPTAPVRYYRGRWTAPKKQSGKFVARRSQAYGADLWCYVQLRLGQPERMIDFPVFDNPWRGCDEAWRAQAAIDANRGQPQQYALRKAKGDQWIMEFFSPVPMWARRRWDGIAEPIAASSCLFAYRIAAAELEEERRFLQDSLWLSEKS